jgi:CheY-like chemotaxis protein
MPQITLLQESPSRGIPRPDVVLVDIRLGEESGFEAARQLAGNGQPAELIMIHARPWRIAPT